MLNLVTKKSLIFKKNENIDIKYEKNVYPVNSPICRKIQKITIWIIKLTLIKASISPTAGMNSGMKGLSLVSRSIFWGVYLKFHTI